MRHQIFKFEVVELFKSKYSNQFLILNQHFYIQKIIHALEKNMS